MSFSYRIIDCPTNERPEFPAGRLYLSDQEDGGEGDALVIMAHEVGLDMHAGDRYAKELAKAGVDSFLFDFRGGYPGEKRLPFSEMSILTESQDLDDVTAFFSTHEDFRTRKLFLLGRSQGGMVAAMSAAKWKDKIDGLALLYPAFVMRDFFLKRLPAREEVPDRFPLLGMQVGKDYLKAALEVDVMSVQSSYRGPVIIFHGTEDRLVPISYSREACTRYAHCKLFEVEGAGHIFKQDKIKEILPYLLSFFKRLTQEKDKPEKLSN